MTKEEIIVGHVYEARHVRYLDYERYYNDRCVCWMSSDRSSVQYDGPAVNIGSMRPVVSMEKFLLWAKKDVTEITPKGTWRRKEKK
jgi:hypothetical protein